jgi:hypothetical protein
MPAGLKTTPNAYEKAITSMGSEIIPPTSQKAALLKFVVFMD